MTDPFTLCPDVRPTQDRNVFLVRSRSGDRLWRVDAEARHGMGICECPDFKKNLNQWCYHNDRVSRLVRIIAMQGCLR